MEKQKPIHTIKLGRIKAAIWENTSTGVTRYRTSAPVRLYKEGETWKDTSSLNRDDLLVAAKVLNLAHTWICTQQHSEKKKSDGRAEPSGSANFFEQKAANPQVSGRMDDTRYDPERNEV